MVNIKGIFILFPTFPTDYTLLLFQNVDGPKTPMHIKMESKWFCIVHNDVSEGMAARLAKSRSFMGLVI